VIAAAYVRSGRTLHRDVGPDVLVMVPGEGRVHVLSGPAAVIWDILGDGAGVEDVTEDVARLYGCTVGEIRSSVEACARTLARHGLVEERRA
jgi:Coenzyme PQQ synthesis protein D (PqqD)